MTYERIKSTILAAMLILALPFLLCKYNSYADENINIEDINLKIAINKELGKSDLNSSITKSEIESLKTISTENGSNKNIKSLSGLEYAINLESADLSNNNIENISSVENIFINGNLNNINLSNQSINLGDQSTLDTKYIISNIVFDIDNNKVTPNYISDNGKYNEGNVIWDNLENFKDYNLYYNFEDNINKDRKSLVFSGEVYEKLKVGGNTSLTNNMPIIKASNKTIKLGDKFDPFENVSAYDVEGKDISDKINVVKNTVNTNKIGSYEVTYFVTDNQGAEANKTIEVYVNKKEENNIEDNIDDNENTEKNNSLNEKDSIDKENNSENKIINVDNDELEENKSSKQKDNSNDEKDKEKEGKESSDISPEMLLAIAGFGIGMGIKFLNMK